MNHEFEARLGIALLYAMGVAAIPVAAFYGHRWWRSFRNWYCGRQRTLKW
jgi:hypothetical protein